MSINLTDFLGQHLVLLWLALAMMLGALELLRNDRTMARIAVCALSAGVVALIFAHLWWLQLTAFVAAVVGSVIGTAVRRRRHVSVGDTPTDSV
jgi:membrane protein implicated in regulation of membrane protease activity